MDEVLVDPAMTIKAIGIWSISFPPISFIPTKNTTLVFTPVSKLYRLFQLCNNQDNIS